MYIYIFIYIYLFIYIYIYIYIYNLYEYVVSFIQNFLTDVYIKKFYHVLRMSFGIRVYHNINITMILIFSPVDLKKYDRYQRIFVFYCINTT